MSKLLSILIPVYNGEAYINRCLNSIVRQGGFNEEVEIVIINDGSKDNSLSILKEYETKYDNIRLISRENKGIGPTRNELLDNVSGNFFWFIDVDDYISTNSLSYIMPLLRNDEYDVLMLSYYWGNQERGRHVKYTGEYTSGLSLTASGIYNNSLWTRVYRTSVVHNNDIRFENLSMGEDFDFIFRLIPLTGRVKCIDHELYYYMENPVSAVFNPNIEHRLNSSKDTMKCLLRAKQMIDKIDDVNTQNVLSKPYSMFIKGYIHSILTYSFPESYKRKVFNKMRTLALFKYAKFSNDLKMFLICAMLKNKKLTALLLYLDSVYMRLHEN